MLHLTAIDLQTPKDPNHLHPRLRGPQNPLRPVVSALVDRALALEEFKGKMEQEVTLHQPSGCAADRVIFEGSAKPKAWMPKGCGGCRKKRQALHRAGTAAPVGGRSGSCGRRHRRSRGIESADGGRLSGQPSFRPLQTGEGKKPLGAHRCGRCAGAGRTPPPPAGRDPDGLQRNPDGPGVGQPALQRKAARNLCADHRPGSQAQGLRVEVFTEKQLQRKKMGALLAVAAGSSHRPAMVVLQHRPATAAAVVLVGKGVTFDSGGITSRPANPCPT